jgi:hypothetical protein
MAASGGLLDDAHVPSIQALTAPTPVFLVLLLLASCARFLILQKGRRFRGNVADAFLAKSADGLECHPLAIWIAFANARTQAARREATQTQVGSLAGQVRPLPPSGASPHPRETLRSLS